MRDAGYEPGTFAPEVWFWLAHQTSKPMVGPSYQNNLDPDQNLQTILYNCYVAPATSILSFN